MSLDHILPLTARLNLVKDMKAWQRKRRKRIRYWFNKRNKPELIDLVRVLIREEIKLIRQENRRYDELNQSLNN